MRLNEQAFVYSFAGVFFGQVVLYEIAVLFTLYLQHNVLNKPRSCSDLSERDLLLVFS